MDTLEQIMTKNVTDKKNSKFMKECCEHIWCRKFDYERHIKSEKHSQMLRIIGQMRKTNEKILQNAQIAATIPQNSECLNVITPIQQCDFLRNSVNLTQEAILPQEIETQKKIETRYVCECCQFSTTNKKESKTHRTTKQHIRNENMTEDFIEIVTKYVCLSCDKSYDKYKSCWEHLKRCDGKKENIVIEIVEQAPSEIKTPSIDIETLKKEIFNEVCGSFVEKIMESNQNTICKIVESNQNTLVKLTESITQNQQTLVQANTNNIQISNNSNNNSNNNNHYTINMFLNEKCKDAINITDWVDQLQVNYDHLYYTGENGFQKGLANMLLDNLKLCNVYNRHIHFTDVKRDSMYIRDANEWTKHENSDKLVEVLELSARQACYRLTEWMREHEDVPDYHNLDSELGQQYLALMVSVIRPEVERLKAFPKVIKELAKTAQLKKEDQV